MFLEAWKNSLTQNQQEQLSFNWTELHSDFTPELIQSWQNHNFTYPQIQEWANAFGTSFNPQDCEFISWLAHIKNYSAEQVLNEHNVESLRQEFQQSQQQAQILQPYST